MVTEGVVAWWETAGGILLSSSAAGGEQKVEIRAADLSDQVPDTDLETRILLQGEPPLTGPDPGGHNPGVGNTVPPNSGAIYDYSFPSPLPLGQRATSLMGLVEDPRRYLVQQTAFADKEI